MPSGNLQNATENSQCENHAGQRAPLNVCHIASGDLWAGAEVQIATLLKFLAKDQRLALSAIVLNKGRLADEISKTGIPLCQLQESELSLSDIIERSTEFMTTRKVEVIHSHRYKENLVAVRASEHLASPRIVRTQHGMPEPQSGVRAIKRGIINLIDRAVARRATDRVISVSQEMSHHLSKLFDPRKVVTIQNGIDAAAVSSGLSPREAKERLGIPPNCPVVGTAGRLEPIKRIDLFLRAAAVILSDQRSTAGGSSTPRSDDVRFVIAGSGRESTALVSFAEKLNIAERVCFLGHRDDIHDVLRALDAFMITSDHEGMPMVLLEVMALGVPVVARAVGGMVEAIENGVNGLLVSGDDPRGFADACASILALPGVAEHLVEGGRRTVLGKFSAATNAEQVAELYLSLCGRK